MMCRFRRQGPRRTRLRWLPTPRIGSAPATDTPPGASDSVLEFDVVRGTAGQKESGALPGFPVSAASCVKAHYLRIPSAAVHQLARRTPRTRVTEVACVRNIDALVVEIFILRPVEQHHVALEIGVPVNRRAPECVNGVVTIVPGVRNRHERRTRRILPFGTRAVVDALRGEPRAILKHRNLPWRRITIRPGHPRDGHTLRERVLRILAEEHIEIAVVGVEHDAGIPNAANQEAIRRCACLTVPRTFQYDAKVLPRQTPITRSCGADAEDRPIRPATHIGRDFMVVVPVPGSALIWNDCFHPHAVTRVREERDRLETLEVIGSRTGEGGWGTNPRRGCEKRPD